MTQKPKQQSARKVGHLWRVGYGPHPGYVTYGYGVTRALAQQEAKEAHAETSKHVEQINPNA